MFFVKTKVNDANDPDYKAFEVDGEVSRTWKLTDENKTAVSEAIAAYLKVMVSSKPFWDCIITEME